MVLYHYLILGPHCANCAAPLCTHILVQHLGCRLRDAIVAHCWCMRRLPRAGAGRRMCRLSPANACAAFRLLVLCDSVLR